MVLWDVEPPELPKEPAVSEVVSLREVAPEGLFILLVFVVDDSPFNH